MEIRQLEAFAAVMSTGSVTGAARLLERSQPAVTRLVHELEAATGYALFTRHGPRVTPTQEGFLLYEEVEHLLGSWRQLQARTLEIAQGGEPLLLAATSAVAVGLLPQALRALEDATGASPVRLQSASPERVLQAVLSGAVQLGAASLPLEHRGLQLLWIGQAPCVAVLADGDPLAAAPQVPLAALARRRIVTLANPYRLRHRIDAVLAQARAPAANKPTDAIETNSSVNAMAMVRAGLGIALLDPLSAHGLPLDGVCVRPLDTDVPFFFGVIVPQGRPLARRAQTLSDALLSAATALPGFQQHPPAAHADLLQAAHAGLQPPPPSTGAP
ncbi:LysR family transcriptional regulator [Pseudorhodoferax sp. Leaf267]|uniref:LysR family transcriptional regulator n=1 Tax=Pseudorhodoferax sp. Leaf267 TaxID=1736316 RepID=UPI0006F8A443|nr:LysR family transcriptional regulator [Pseudorhodoferax sp. Leaf267]KQP23565.1 LysR family transcriptional regulator [Pseudorhodoferax sp. Leaf267]